MVGKQQFVIRSLTCKRDLDMPIVAYNSFLHYNRQDSRLVVHTDGTLSEFDVNRLCRSVRNIEVIDRKSSEEQVKEALAKYPECLEFRALHSLSNKLYRFKLIGMVFSCMNV